MTTTRVSITVSTNLVILILAYLQSTKAAFRCTCQSQPLAPSPGYHSNSRSEPALTSGSKRMRQQDQQRQCCQTSAKPHQSRMPASPKRFQMATTRIQSSV